MGITKEGPCRHGVQKRGNPVDTTRMQCLVFFACGLLAAACKPNAAKPDAAPIASGADVAKKAAPPVDPDPVVDLLHTVDATVAVSSKVDNPHDYPEHLVDGKPETAWNSKTGDLKGWIAFRVPSSAKVVRVEITPGFDKKATKGDLFTMNHRIKKVRISREGQVLTEAPLDIDNRALQAIELDAPGGDFKLEVLETVPGTQKKWRELTVSEFRVWGRAGGAPTNPAHIPKMAIGSLDGRPPAKPIAKAEVPPGPFATAAELCAAYDKAITPLIDAKYTDEVYPGKIAGPHCSLKQSPKGFSNAAFKTGPFKDATFATIDTLDEQTSVLLLQTEKGWFITDVRAWSRYHTDPGCMHASTAMFEDVAFAKSSTGQEVALIRVLNRDVRWGNMTGDFSGADTTESVHACRVDAAGAVACEGPKTLATAHEAVPPTWTPADSSFVEIDVAKVPWASRKKPNIGPAGDLRLE